MKKINNILAFLAVLIILVAIGWGGYVGIQFLIRQYDIIDPQLAATLIIFSVVLLICALIVAGAIRSLDRGSDKQIHPEKAVLYTQFLESWYNKEKQARNDQLKSLKENMLIWAGDNVLHEYLELNELIQRDHDAGEVIQQAEVVLTEIRKDLGANNKNIDSERIQKLLHIMDSD